MKQATQQNCTTCITLHSKSSLRAAPIVSLGSCTHYIKIAFRDLRLWWFKISWLEWLLRAWYTSNGSKGVYQQWTPCTFHLKLRLIKACCITGKPENHDLKLFCSLRRITYLVQFVGYLVSYRSAWIEWNKLTASHTQEKTHAAIYTDNDTYYFVWILWRLFVQ